MAQSLTQLYVHIVFHIKSNLDKTKEYIKRQEEHHMKRSFQEEYLLFLKEYGIDYDEHFLWSD